MVHFKTEEIRHFWIIKNCLTIRRPALTFEKNAASRLRRMEQKRQFLIMGKKTGLPNFRKAGLSWIQIILLATAGVYPSMPPTLFLHPQPFPEPTEGTGQMRRKPEMNNIPWGHLKLNVFRESLLTRLPASWLYLLSIQARFGLNCNPIGKGKGVKRSPNIFEHVFPFSFSSLITVSHICQSAPYPRCFCPDKHLIQVPWLLYGLWIWTGSQAGI